MTNEPCVILGDFSNWRPVVGRKVLQLTIEVPIEQTRDVLEKLGQPIPGQSLWVGVALVKPERAREPEAAKTSVASGSTKDRKPFSSLPLSQQAALRCTDEMFYTFLQDRKFLVDHDAAESVRQYCGVTSRSELDDTRKASARHQWTILDAAYQAYLTDRQYAEARR